MKASGFGGKKNNIMNAKTELRLFNSRFLESKYETIDDFMIGEKIKREDLPDGISNQSKEHIEGLKKISIINKSGYAGVLPDGSIVDRRDNADAVAVQENRLLGIPKPKELVDWKELNRRHLNGEDHAGLDGQFDPS